MSSAFHAHEGEQGHGGHGVAESNGKYFVIGHHDGKVYESDEHGNILTEETKDARKEILKFLRFAQLTSQSQRTCS
jgi:predicted MPP superfamily phosphohydrolase